MMRRVLVGIVALALGVGGLSMATATPELAAAATFASPPPNALTILWADYCGRVTDPLCEEASPSPPASPSPSPTGAPSAQPSQTPAPTASPSPTATSSPSPTATATATPSPTTSPSGTPSPIPSSVPGTSFILIARADLMALPTSGAAWGGVLTQAAKTADVQIGALNSNGDVITLAKALVYARTGDAARRIEVIAAFDKLRADTGIPDGPSGEGRALELSRGVGAYVLAADLIGYRDPAFVTWVGQQPSRPTNDKTILTCAAGRPNNWGTWCRSSLLIIHLYLGAGTAQDVAMFRGYLGERAQYARFSYGDLSWQANPSLPVGINPVGAVKSGHSIDGVLPDDQRRAGSFAWPPPCENYVAEALQGLTLEATVLTRAGFPAWTYSDSAIGRAVEFKYTNGCPFTGDDSSTPFVTDAAYGTSHAGSIPSQPGKGWGYGEWLFP